MESFLDQPLSCIRKQEGNRRTIEYRQWSLVVAPRE